MTCDHVFINVLWVSSNSSKVNIWLQLVFISEVKEATNWNSDVYFLAGFEWVYQNVLPPLLCKFKCWPILLSAACSEIEQNMGKRVRKTTRRKVVWTRKQYKGKGGKWEVIRQTRKDTNPQLHCKPWNTLLLCYKCKLCSVHVLNCTPNFTSISTVFFVMTTDKRQMYYLLN